MRPRAANPASRYAALWAHGRPDVDAFLADAGPLEPDALAAVLRVDQRERWRAGERAPAEGYVRRLGDPPDPEAALDLIYNEFLIREQLGEPPDLDDLCRRFPAHAASLREQVALHRAVATRTRPGSTAGGPEPAPEASERLPRPFGRYELLSELGRGAMGTVYLARDPLLDRQVALKIPRFAPGHAAQAAERFRREARAAAAIRHPHVCPVFDVGQVDGVDYLTMPYFPGEPLSERLGREGALPERDAARVAMLAAEGVEAAHRAGVVHRDLKPSNVLLDDRGEPVVTDFGLARRATAGDPRLTDPGAVLGTAAYMPPEQVKGDAEAVGPRSDVYSLGVMLYEMLTGEVPFRGNTVGEVLHRVLHADPRPPSRARPGLDGRLEAACLRAMAKDPAKRFASMADFAAALRPLTEDRPPARPRWALGLLFWAAAGLAPALLALILAAVAWVATRPAPAPPTGASAPETAPDPFHVGAVWEGTFRFGFDPPGTRRRVVLTVTERSGSTFRGLYTTEDKYQWWVEGTAGDGRVSWKLTQARTPEAVKTGATGQAEVSGSYGGGTMAVTYHDHNSDTKMELRPRQ